MRVKPWILLSLASLVLVSCAGESVKQQATENSTPVTTSSSTQTTQPEAIAQATPATKSITVKSGNFASGEHATQGIARIVTQAGETFLELDEGFKTSDMGPDLVVILHRSSDVLSSTKPPAYPLKEGDYTLLAPLQKFSGAQRYAIPAKVNLAEYESAAIWCRKFNATFGAAKLVSQ